ncbi:MAG: hypothetical protein NZL93_05295, partial [Chthoniobacterales bacterium]|nr:hypothetical protein [Chthoniobacterales bacterium]
SLGKSVSFATDALQTHGLWPRSGQPPRFHNRDLPSIRHQAEHSLVALQSEVFRLPPGASAKFGICLLYCDHHPNPSSPDDFNLAAHARQLAYQKLATLTPPPSNTPELPTTTQNQTLFTAPFFESEEPKFDDILVTYGENLRHLEKDQQGLILSFFTDDGRHIVSQRKEREVLRPHGHILRTNETWEPLESEVSATAWMAGIFAAQLAQGHPSANRLLSTALSYLALQRAAGIRIWVEENGQWLLLGIPTLWEISLTRCRWLYKKENIQIEISLQTNPNLSSLDFSANVTSGPPLRFLLAAHLALDDRNGRGSLNPSLQIHPNSIQIFPHPNSFVAKRFPNGFFEVETSSPELWEFRGPATPLAPNNPQTASEWPFLCLQSAPTLNLSLKFHGRLLSPISPQTNTQPFHSSIHNIIHIENRFQNPNFSDLQKFETITPWFAHNAAIHYLSPRGLEQYSGGGWGVRDVCQGAFE